MSQITKHVEREIIHHSNFCHPHIVQFKEVFLTQDYLAIAMEFVPGGDMFQHVKKNKGLQESEVGSDTLWLACLSCPYTSKQSMADFSVPLLAAG